MSKTSWTVVGILVLAGILSAIAQTDKPLPIPDFKCPADGQMVSGFRAGKPVCSVPAGFLMPDLKCDESQGWNPKVLVGIKDGRPVCKGIYFDYDQNIMTNVYSSDTEIHIQLHLIPKPQ